MDAYDTADIPDDGDAHTGTLCAPHKVCMNHLCTDHTSLGYSCETTELCSRKEFATILELPLRKAMRPLTAKIQETVVVWLVVLLAHQFNFQVKGKVKNLRNVVMTFQVLAARCFSYSLPSHF